MKKIFVYMASAALVFAASCNKIEEANTPVDTPAETELITVELNPQTKTSLKDMSTVWTAGDKVNVTVGEEVIGTLTLVSGSTFKGEITAGLEGGTSVTLNYPVDEDGKTVTTVPATQTAAAGSFAQGAALLEGTTTVADLRAKKGATLENKTALLSFSTPVAGDVAFTIGNATYTVEGCETDKTYYACVDPAKSGKLSYTVGIVLGGKGKANFAPVANEVYSLGALTLKESMFGVIGNTNAWEASDDVKMYLTTQDNLFVAYGVSVTNTEGFKVRKAGGWVNEYNYGSINTTTKTVNSAVGVYTDGGSSNIKVATGTYDIWFDRIAGQVYIMEQGKSYTEASKQATPSTVYNLIGSFEGSNWTDIPMTYSGDGIWTIQRTFKANDNWKIRKTNDWNENWGGSNVTLGQNLRTTATDGNVVMKSAGDYIMIFVRNSNRIDIINKES